MAAWHEKPEYVAVLACGHELRYSLAEPTPAAIVLCRRCGWFERILDRFLLHEDSA